MHAESSGTYQMDGESALVVLGTNLPFDVICATQMGCGWEVSLM